MTTTTRPCAYCHAPLAGRADKVYCSSSCKSKDFRRQQADTPWESDEEPQQQGAPRPGGRAPQPGARPPGGGPFSKVDLQDAHPRPRRGAAPAPDEAELDAELDEPDEEGDSDEELDEEDAPLRSGEHLQQLVERALNQHELQQLPQRYRKCLEQVLAATDELQDGRQLRHLREAVQQTIRAYTVLGDRRPLPPVLAPHLTDLYRLQELLEAAEQAVAEQDEPVELHIKKKWRAQLRASLALVGRP